MLDRILDRLVLCPTTDPIDPEGRQRRSISTPAGEIEAWLTRSTDTDHPPGSLAIKFPGTGGRAERGGPHPFELRPDQVTEVWTINPIGYGGSPGRATLQSFAQTCDAVWDHVRQLHPDLPITLVGNSLGCASALYLAARKKPAGIFLRNPVALKQMIAGRPRYNWWNFGLARFIAGRIPAEIDTVENAKNSHCPLLVIRSEHDRVSPASYQQMIFNNYAGSLSEFVIRGADHHDQVPEAVVNDYICAVEKWFSQIAQ